MSRVKRTLSAYLSPNYWRYTFLTRETVTLLFAVLGGLWLPVECIAFFFPAAGTALKAWWPLLLAGGTVFLLWQRRPVLSVAQRLAQRDVELEVRVADIFDIDAARVIGINTTFDTDIEGGLISTSSLQGQFTQRYYDSVKHLDADIDRLLVQKNAETVPGKLRGKTARYEIGTTLRLKPKGHTFYLVAIAHMNEQGVAHSTFDNIKTSLASLWEYMGRESVGGLEPIAIPILGSGNTRLTETRQVIAREIINSFIAACASRKFCEKFILAISPDDYRKHQIDLYELRDFVQHVCRYTEFKATHDAGLGVGIDDKDSTVASAPGIADSVECAEQTAAEEFDAALYEHQIRWSVERDSKPHTIDEGKSILHDFGDDLFQVCMSHRYDFPHGAKLDVMGLIRDTKTIQNHEVYLDGGKSYAKFWELGDLIFKKAENAKRRMEGDITSNASTEAGESED